MNKFHPIKQLVKSLLEKTLKSYNIAIFGVINFLVYILLSYDDRWLDLLKYSNVDRNVISWAFIIVAVIFPISYSAFDIFKAYLRRKVYSEVEREYLSNISEEDLKEVDIARKKKYQRAEILLERNLRSNFVLKKVQFKNANILGDIQWQPSPKINIILGRNGYGKSYLLRLVIGLLSYDNDRLSDLVGLMDDGFDMRIDILRDGKPATIEHDGVAFDESTGKVPVLAIPDSRFVNRARKSITSDESDYAELNRHGAHHFLYDKPYDATIQSVLAQMCIEAIGANKGEDIKYPRSPQLDLMSDTIFALSGEKFLFQRISAVGSGRFEIIVETEASPDNPISIQKASQGTMSIIAIFGLIYQFIRKLHPDISGNKIFEQTAIVMIDEVDAHLHPTWQRKIVMLLRRTFPKVQFFLTAHSPLIVAGCSYGEISVLKRQDKMLKLIEYQNDFVGTSIDEIYEELFEIGDRDDTFLEYYAQLPLVQEFKEIIERERSSNDPDENLIERIEARLEKIQKVLSKEDQELEHEMLARENEQLRRQLETLQRSTEQPS